MTQQKLPTIPPGKYVAKAKEGVWCKVGEKETPAVGVRFEFDIAEGKREEHWHIMYLTQTMCTNGLTVFENTMNNLATLGYDESKDLIKREDGNMGFDFRHLADKEVQLVIEHEADQKNPQKIYARVRWINELSGARMTGISFQEVLGNKNLKAEMAAARARMGAPKPASNSNSAAKKGTGPDFKSDVPF